ncbi:MAG: hypothetical protein ACLRM8_02155 [Alistipes sp.]
MGLNARLFAIRSRWTSPTTSPTPNTSLPRAPVWFGRLRKHVRADGQRRKQGFRAFDPIRQDSRDFSWSSSLTLSHNKNKVVELMNNY